MALSKVVRARVLMDLLKDGDVSTEANYASDKIDYVDGPTALKYVNAFVSYFGGPTGSGVTNEDIAAFYINQLRRYHRDIYVHEKERDEVPAIVTEGNEEVETDLGSNE